MTARRLRGACWSRRRSPRLEPHKVRSSDRSLLGVERHPISPRLRRVDRHPRCLAHVPPGATLEPLNTREPARTMAASATTRRVSAARTPPTVERPAPITCVLPPGSECRGNPSVGPAANGAPRVAHRSGGGPTKVSSQAETSKDEPGLRFGDLGREHASVSAAAPRAPHIPGGAHPSPTPCSPAPTRASMAIRRGSGLGQSHAWYSSTAGGD